MKETATLGAIGVTSTTAGLTVSFMSHVTAGMQFLSLLIGIVIGIWTLYRMWKNEQKRMDDE